MVFLILITINLCLSERRYSHSAGAPCSCRAVALCGCSHNCACVSKLPPLIMLHPRTARRYAQIYAEFFIKNFCIQFFKVAREATVPAAPYYILTIVTEHFADADTLFRQKTVLAYTKHPHVSSPEAEPSGSLAHKVPKGVVS